jgi:diguanylate cyclase (GGDEF)-like protein
MNFLDAADSFADSAIRAFQWARNGSIALVISVLPDATLAQNDPLADHPLFTLDCLADGQFDGETRLQELEQWRDEAGPESPELQGQWLYCRATALEKTGDLDGAHSSYTEAIEAYGRLPEPVIGVIRALLDRSYVDYLRTNDTDRYCPDRTEALRLARAIGDPEALLTALNQNAFCFAQDPEQLPQGLGLLEEALELARDEAMSPGQLGMIYNATATIYQNNQLLEPALTHLELAYQAWQEEDDRQDMFNMLHGLIQTSVRLGRWDEAERHLERMRELTERSPSFEDFPFFIAFNAGSLAKARGDHAEAIRAFEQALALEATTQERYFVALTQRNLALSKFRTGDVRAAAGHARAFIDSTDVRRGDPELLSARGVLAFAEGRELEAAQTLLDMLDAERARTLVQLQRNSAGQAAIHDRRLEAFQTAILRERLDYQELQLAQSRQAQRNARLLNALIGVTAVALLVLVGFLFWSRQRFRKHARTDSLTGIANRRHAMNVAERGFGQSRSGDRPFALLLLDIDHFKRINDRFGHDVGDRAIRGIASNVGDVLPPDALFGRMGGEEFMIALPDYTRARAVALAETIRKQVSDHPIDADGVPVRLTISIGVAERTEATAKLDALYRNADQALYAAKRKGRDQIAADDAGSGAG